MAIASAGAKVAEAERQKLIILLSAAADGLRDRERKLRELTDWWWVPAYGQYLSIRTLADHDIEGYNNLARSLNQTNAQLQDSQQALVASSELRNQLQAASHTAARTVAGLKDMRARADAELGELKKAAVALTDASALWAKAGNVLAITAADKLDSLETIQQLLDKPTTGADFADPSQTYAGDLEQTLVRFGATVDNGSNFLLNERQFCGGPARDPGAAPVSQPCAQVEQITRYYEITDPKTCSFRYANPPGCPPFEKAVEVSPARVAQARAGNGWTRAAGENWIGGNRCRLTVTMFYGWVDGADACEEICMSDQECRFWTYNGGNAMMPNSRYECWGGRAAAEPAKSPWPLFHSGGKR